MKNRFAITPELSQRVGRPHKPLRSFRELAEDFGVSMGKLATELAKNPGPKPKLVHRRHGRSDSWYDPSEMRAWWAKLHA
jgi:hypothetical protein